MLVYSCNLILAPDGGVDQIIELIGRWISKKAGGGFSGRELAQGVLRKKLRNGSSVTSKTSASDVGNITFPYVFSIELSHRDDQVAGRLWTTGIGIRQINKDGPIECTFLLKTDEASTRVHSPPQVTRPRIVLDIVGKFHPFGETPGLKVKELNTASAIAFLAEVERKDRLHPIVVLSPQRDGNYLVQPERVRSLLVGIADVVKVAADANTFAIEKLLGKKYGAWGGAINVLSRAKNGGDGRTYCESFLYRPDRLFELAESGTNPESEIFSAVLHQTNVPLSWRHISLSVVDQAALRGQLNSALERAKETDDGGEYIKLLEDAIDQIGVKDAIISELQCRLQDTEDQIAKLSANVQSLKYSLAG